MPPAPTATSGLPMLTRDMLDGYVPWPCELCGNDQTRVLRWIPMVGRLRGYYVPGSVTCDPCTQTLGGVGPPRARTCTA